MDEMGKTHEGLEDDLLNFQWDPVACAVALDWPTVETRETRLTATRRGSLLRLREDANGRPVRVLTDLDAARFQQAWRESIAY
jgi:purine nucleosidase